MLDNGGEMPDAVKNRLAALDIGKYYIFANIEEGDTYTGLGPDMLGGDFFDYG